MKGTRSSAEHQNRDDEAGEKMKPVKKWEKPRSHLSVLKLRILLSSLRCGGVSMAMFVPQVLLGQGLKQCRDWGKSRCHRQSVNPNIIVSFSFREEFLRGSLQGHRVRRMIVCSGNRFAM